LEVTDGPDSDGWLRLQPQQATQAGAVAGAVAGAGAGAGPGPGGSVVISQGSQQGGQYVAPQMQSADMVNLGSDAVTVQVK
jgi:hypothetical protein